MKKLLFLLLILCFSVVTSCFTAGSPFPSGGREGSASDFILEDGSVDPSFFSDDIIEGDLVPDSFYEIFPSPIGRESISGVFSDSVIGKISFGTGDSPSSSSEFFQAQAGQITSSALDDHEYFEEWLDTILGEESSLKSVYESFTNTIQRLYADQILVVKIINDDLPLENVMVEIEQTGFKAISNAFGIAYLFGDIQNIKNLKLKLTYQDQTLEFEDLEINEGLVELNTSFEVKEMPKVLDLALVVDTTGSMGDEIRYLKVELQDVLERIQDLGVGINLALIFYRDQGDAYVTRVFDFTTDLPKQYQRLSKQFAQGGGDTPEAVHEALKCANNLSWSENTTKLMIHVCDAPIHSEEKIMNSFADSVLALTTKGVRMIPVICSGSDDLCELTFRLAAMYTGGTYTYVTDDSGIGNAHAAPTTKVQTVVEYLNKMLERLVKQYLFGEKITPEPYYKENAYYLTVQANINQVDQILGFIVAKDDELTVQDLLEKYDIKQGDVVLVTEEGEIEYDITLPITSDLVLRIIVPLTVEIDEPSAETEPIPAAPGSYEG